MATTKETGFWATDHATYYRTPSGAIWFSSIDFDGLRQAREIPSDAIEADTLMTPAEMEDFIRQVEQESGE